MDLQKPHHYGPCQVAGHQKWIFQGAAIVVGLEVVNSRYCLNYFITYEWKIMQILLIGQLLLCILAKHRVRIAWYIKMNLLGFNFHLNQPQQCNECYGFFYPSFFPFLCFRFYFLLFVKQRDATHVETFFFLSSQGLAKYENCESLCDEKSFFSFISRYWRERVLQASGIPPWLC